MNEEVKKFLEVFNSIENWLRAETGSEKEVSFNQLLHRGAAKIAVVRHEKDSLRQMADLRNLIVHDRDFPNRYVAIPGVYVCEQIEQIWNTLANPGTVYEHCSRQVVIHSLGEPLINSLREMRDGDYSQVLVADGNDGYGLVTREGVTTWMESNYEDDLVSLRDISLKDVWDKENSSRWAYVGRRASIHDALDRHYWHLASRI